MAKTLLSQNAFSKIGALCGVLTLVLLFVAFPSAGFVPIPSPSLTADEVAAHYASHQTPIRVVGTMMSLIGITYCLFTATLSAQLSRIPGVPLVAIYTQLIGGCWAGLYITLPGYFLLVAAYRPERSPELILLLNDFFWILLLMNFPAFIAQDFAFSYAILQDRRRKPLFPHWLAGFTTGLTVLYWPAMGIPFVRTGVLAWDGALSFWVSVVAAVVNLGSLSFFVWRAVGRGDVPGDGEVSKTVDIVEAMRGEEG